MKKAFDSDDSDYWTSKIQEDKPYKSTLISDRKSTTPSPVPTPPEVFGCSPYKPSKTSKEILDAGQFPQPAIHQANTHIFEFPKENDPTPSELINVIIHEMR